MGGDCAASRVQLHIMIIFPPWNSFDKQRSQTVTRRRAIPLPSNIPYILLLRVSLVHVAALKPPSRLSTQLFAYLFLIRNKAASATSSGLPNRPDGTRLMVSASIPFGKPKGKGRDDM